MDESVSVLKTFNDYQEELNTKLLEYKIHEKSRWANLTLMDANIPDEILVVMIKRGREVIVPRGSTVILPGDTLVLSGNDIEEQLKAQRRKLEKEKAQKRKEMG